MFSNKVSSATPRQVVPSFDHLVTQWMSTVTSSVGRSQNSGQVQLCSVPTSSVMVKLHRSRGTRGVGPALRTGKS
jgi:hypothetical protein